MIFLPQKTTKIRGAPPRLGQLREQLDMVGSEVAQRIFVGLRQGVPPKQGIFGVCGVSWCINMYKPHYITIVIGIIDYSYWSYVHQLGFLQGTPQIVAMLKSTDVMFQRSSQLSPLVFPHRVSPRVSPASAMSCLPNLLNRKRRRLWSDGLDHQRAHAKRLILS